MRKFKLGFWEHRIPRNTKQSKDVEDFLLSQITAAHALGRKEALEELRERIEKISTEDDLARFGMELTKEKILSILQEK